MFSCANHVLIAVLRRQREKDLAQCRREEYKNTIRLDMIGSNVYLFSSVCSNASWQPSSFSAFGME